MLKELSLKFLMNFLTILLLNLLLSTTVVAANYYVSPTGNNSSGRSWQDAWNEMDQIDWNVILPGDTVYIDGGESSMTYNTTLSPATSGTDNSPITITVSDEQGRSGYVHINGGRKAQLPECGQASYEPYSSAADVNQLAQGVKFQGVSYIVLDGGKWEGFGISQNAYGVRFYADTSDITLRNLKIYDNGRVFQADDGASTGLWYSDNPGIRIEGSDHTFERLHIHDNGQDGIQSGGGSEEKNLRNLTINESWLHNYRIHSGRDNSPSGDTPDELGAPQYGPSYNGYQESFNWCRHSDAVQVFNGGNVSGFTFTNSVFGPGHTNTLMLGDTSGGGATITNFTLENSLILKGADNNINGKDGLNDHDNWVLRNITVFSPNTKYNGVRIYGANHKISESIFYGGRAYFENSLAVDSGNCVYQMEGHSFGSIFTNPLLSSLYDDSFTTGDYKPLSESDCAGKGSSITNINQFLQLVSSSDNDPTPAPTTSPAPTASPTNSPAPDVNGDVNGDGRVDLTDYELVINSFETADSAADFNGDGIVDIFDVSLVIDKLQ